MTDGPIDRYYIVFLVFLIQGIGCLMPWNFVITADQFFRNRLEADNSTIYYATNFLSFAGIGSKVPNIAFQAINVFLLGGIGMNLRIMNSIIVQIIMFSLLILLVLVEMKAIMFFWLTMAIVVGANIGNGIYQNCIYGTAALLPPRFVNVVVIGNNISGVFTALLLIVSIWASPDPTKSAFYYFSSAVIYLIVCLIAFIYVQQNNYYLYYKNQQFTDDDTGLTTQNKEPEPIDMKTLFPSVLGAVETTGNSIPKQYFAAVGCFLFFNLFAMLGNYASDLLPKIPRKTLIIAVLLRFAFIPLFLMCNYQPSHKPNTRAFSVLITNDYLYMLLVMLHGFTSGWFSSLSMTYAPMIVEAKYKSIAGMISSISLLFGILIGINFSIIWPYLMLKQL